MTSIVQFQYLSCSSEPRRKRFYQLEHGACVQCLWSSALQTPMLHRQPRSAEEWNSVGTQSTSQPVRAESLSLIETMDQNTAINDLLRTLGKIGKKLGISHNESKLNFLSVIAVL